MSLNLKALVVIVLAILLLATFTIVAYVEGAQKRVGAPPPAVASAEAQQCIDCHSNRTPGIVTDWRTSMHAEKGVDCLSCHKVQSKDDWDAFTCPGSATAIAQHPTPKDCAQCHEQQVAEFGRSKHAALGAVKFAGSTDRTVLEPTIATKNGCQECHKIGHVWPDQSIGDCSACHTRHTFSLVVARAANTCGECHMGPDHSNIETWVESKHGNIFMANPKNYEKLAYKTEDYKGKAVPLPAPTCSTCHMDATPTLPATHDVGERLAWETQSPWSIRTTEAWGNGQSWQQKRTNMENVCAQCHSQNFYQRYFLTGDLSAIEYNEIYREGKRWLTAMNVSGIILTPSIKDSLGVFGREGYDDPPEQDIYLIWHHDGRLFRQGALMGGADFTQWHGIWELQKDMINIIRYGADNNLSEARSWMKSDDPAKYWLYPIIDVPGSPWGTDTIAFRKSPEFTTKILMNRDVVPDYWDQAKANVQAAYKNGLLSDAQWALYQKVWDNRDKENGSVYPLPKDIAIAQDGDKRDATAATTQAADFKMPFGSVWSNIKQTLGIK